MKLAADRPVSMRRVRMESWVRFLAGTYGNRTHPGRD